MPETGSDQQINQPVFGVQLNPQDAQILGQEIAIPYTTTQPTATPRYSGTRYIYFDGTSYWFYVYANGAWRSTPLTGVGFPGSLAQGDIFYVNSSGAVARLPAGTSGKFLKTQGTGADPTWDTISADSGLMEQDFTYVEQPSTGDLVSYIPPLTTSNIVMENNYDGTNTLHLGDVDTTIGTAVRFTMPITLSNCELTVYIAKTGTPTYSIDMAIYTDSSDKPGSAVSGGSRTIAGADVTGTLTAYTHTVTGSLTRGTKYWVVLKASNYGSGFANYFLTYAQGAPFFNFQATDTANYNYSSPPGLWQNAGGSSSIPRFSLTGTVTGGVYKTIDLPSCIGTQGGTLGIVKSVDTGAGTCRVILGGVYTTSGLTAGSNYYASTSTAGALTTTEGTTLVGKALSTTQLYVYPKKIFKKSFSGSPIFAFGATHQSAFDVMLGFRGTRASARLAGSSICFYGDSDSGGMKVSNSSQSASGFFDSTDTQGASGSVAFTYSLLSFSDVTKGSSSGNLSGVFTIEG